MSSTVIDPLTRLPPTPLEQLVSANKVLTPRNAKMIASLKSTSYWLGVVNSNLLLELINLSKNLFLAPPPVHIIVILSFLIKASAILAISEERKW